MYTSSIILLIGAEVNAILDERLNLEVVLDKANPHRQTEDRDVLLERVRHLAEHERRHERQIDPVMTIRASRQDMPGDLSETLRAQRVGRGAGIALLVSMASVLPAGFIGAIRRRSHEHA